jgi:lipopolysaccharide exporter
MEALSSIKTSRPQLKQGLARVRKSSFVKNVLVVMSGTAVAQIIGFAMSPIISRLFSPSDYGVFGSFDAVLGVIVAGVTLDYSQAIMLPKEKGDAINLFFVSCLSTSAVGLLCLMVCLIFPTNINKLMKTEGIWALAFLALASIVAGLNLSSQAWCVRVKAFKHTSASQVSRSLSSNGAQVGFGLFNGGATGLIVSSVLANILASFNLLWVIVPDIKTFWQGIRWHRMKELAIEYRDFPMYSGSQNVINALSNSLPVLLLGHFYGIAVAGAYAFGERILSAPMGLVLTALRQVLFQNASEIHNKGGRIMPLYVKITLGLFALALLPALVLFIWAPQLFTWIFGYQWNTAGEFARWLILWLTFYFCNLPSVLFARIIRIQRTIFYFSQSVLIVRILTLLIGGMYMSSLYTIMLFSVVGALINISGIFIVGLAIKKKEGDIVWKDISIV